MSFTSRVSVLILFTVSLLTVSITSLVYLSAKSTLNQQFKSSIKEDYRQARLGIIPNYDGSFSLPNQTIISGSTIQLISSQGQISQSQTSSQNTNTEDPLPQELNQDIQSQGMQVASQQDQELWVKKDIGDNPVMVYIGFSGVPNWAIMVARPYNYIQDSLSQLANNLIKIAIIIFLISCLLTFLLSKTISKPLRKLKTTIQQIALSQNVHTRVPNKGNDEIAEISRSFNNMMDQIEEIISTQTQFAADAAHELKTPITVLKTNFDLLKVQPNQEEIIEDIQSELEEMKTTINTLLLLSRKQTQTETIKEWPEVIHQEANDLQQIFPSIKIRIENNFSQEPQVLQANFDLYILLVNNLIRNACQWAKQEVTITIFHNGFEICDDGPGVNPAEQELIWGRFYRSSKRRGHDGNGLGLPLVKKIAELSNAQVSLKLPSNFIFKFKESQADF